jgi:hypothetical protein
MTLSVLLKSKPADKSPERMREVFRRIPGRTVAVDGLDSSFAEMQNLREIIQEFPSANLQLVFDLTQVTDLGNWSSILIDILKTRDIGNATLPEQTKFLLIIDDQSTLDAKDVVESLESAVDFVVHGSDNKMFAAVRQAIHGVVSGMPVTGSARSLQGLLGTPPRGAGVPEDKSTIKDEVSQGTSSDSNDRKPERHTRLGDLVSVEDALGL